MVCYVLGFFAMVYEAIIYHEISIARFMGLEIWANGFTCANPEV
jgi:hypothetical protein